MEYDDHLKGFSAVPKGQTTFSTPTINYYHGLREGLETLTSFTPTNNHCHSLREGLEILTSFAPINNHCHGLRKELETRTFSAPTNNYYRSLKEGLETQLMSTTSTSSVNGFDIPEVIPSSIEPVKTGYSLWRGHCRHFGIKDLTPATFFFFFKFN